MFLSWHKLFLSLAILFVAVANQSCESERKEKVKEPEYVYDSTTSELSNVMRQMYEGSVKARENVLKGEPVEFDWDVYQKIATAEPTNPKLKEGIYLLHSEQFLNSADKLRKAKKDQIAAYNVMIVNCLNCHTNRCPGPMPRIKKLEIANL